MFGVGDQVFDIVLVAAETAFAEMIDRAKPAPRHDETVFAIGVEVFAAADDGVNAPLGDMFAQRMILETV